MLRSISKLFTADIGTAVLCAHPAAIRKLLCHGRTSRKMLNSSHYCLHLVLLLFGFRNLVEGQESTNISDYPFRNVSLPWNERVADLVQRLTVEEIRDQMAYGGSVFGPVPAIPRLGIQPYNWDTECLRGDAKAPGFATAFPQSIGLAASFSTDLIFRVAEAASVEVRGKHNDFVKQGNYSAHTGASCFSPVINIMRDPRWGRNQETYGEDPYLSGVFAANYIRGLQGDNERYVRASGGCKHFDVHGGPENIPVSRASFNAIVSDRDWRMTFLPAFRVCVEAGTFSVMCSYNRINGIPACANPELLTAILRDEWNFTGYVVSDEGAIELIITAHKFLNNTVDTVAVSVKSGVNLELPGHQFSEPVFYSLVDAVNQGKLSEDTVRERVAPLFYTRMRLGEFDPPEMNPYANLTSQDVETSAHRALAVEAAMKSFVLLKNDGVLPISSPKLGIIAVVGPMADNVTEQFGDYNPVPDPQFVTTPLDGLRPLATSVQFAPGCDSTRCAGYDKASVLNAVSGAEMVFVVLGTGPSIESEGNDRPNIELPGLQGNLLSDVIANAPPSAPIILLLINAGPLNITLADRSPRVSAILECFFPAQAAGDAILHVLLNDVPGAVPAGRLPFTWPLLASQIPEMVNYSMDGRTYRYSHGEVLYPFGYGLSYSSFHYTAVTHTTFVHAGQPLLGQVYIYNVGGYDADEVVQVYIGWRNFEDIAPIRQLVWFDRISMKAGQQSLVVKFQVAARDMALWHDDGWRISQGMMDLYVGGQQPFQTTKASGNVIVDEFEIVGSKYLGRY